MKNVGTLAHSKLFTYLVQYWTLFCITNGYHLKRSRVQFHTEKVAEREEREDMQILCVVHVCDLDMYHSFKNNSVISL